MVSSARVSFLFGMGAVLFVYQPKSQSLDVLVCDFNQVENDTTSNLKSGPISYTVTPLETKMTLQNPHVQ